MTLIKKRKYLHRRTASVVIIVSLIIYAIYAYMALHASEVPLKMSTTVESRIHHGMANVSRRMPGHCLKQAISIVGNNKNCCVANEFSYNLQ